MKRHFYILLILLFGTIMSVLPQSMTISGGTEYGVVICNKGFVYAWGKNTNGVLGIDPAESGNTPNAANITRPQKVKLPSGIIGKDMPATDYWYEINIKEINKQYVGHFTLLRR